MTARPTPFDLMERAFGDVLASLDDAARATGRDPLDRRDFAQVPAVQRLLGDLAASPEGSADPDANEELLAVLHAVYRFARAGKPVRSVSRARLEPCLRDRPAAAFDVPGGACYVQLPATWFWATRAADAPHEPLDGMFVVRSPRGDEITVVGVLGLRPDRHGFTQVTVHARPTDVAAAHGMQRDPPFAPRMDGGERAGFRSVATAAELLALAHLALATADE